MAACALRLPNSGQADPVSARKSGRLPSLDAFRGFAIASMILVNNPGDWNLVYAQLDHAAWNGWTFTDTIFPFFLFICGVAMALSIARYRAAGRDCGTMMRQFAMRAAIIFAIGLILNLLPSFDLAALRIPGVLQRIGLCILIGAPLALWSGGRGNRVLLFSIVLMLSAYSAAMLAMPVPGFDGRIATGVLEPGRDVGSFVDRWIFGSHLWATSKTWDPEGLVSTLPAACTLLFGTIAGQWLLQSRSARQAVIGLVAAGFGSLIAGALLDSLLMPINKNLWTPSFCLLMNGWALLAFAAFYWLLDGRDNVALRKQARHWLSPLTIYGMNALFLFVLSGLVARLIGAVRVSDADGALVALKAWLYAPIAGLPVRGETASLMFAMMFDLAMFVVAWWMWKKRWFIRA